MLRASEPGPQRLRRFVVTFVLLFACLLAWSAATPMYGSADEQVHMVTAYAVVHGVEGSTNAEGYREFAVPAVYTGETLCYAFRPETSASCLFFDSDAPDHRATSTAWDYPPFYYLIVGWPTLLSSGLAGLYLMRIVAAAAAAALLALAVHNLDVIGAPRALAMGVALALTPAVFSFGAAVNPTGLSLAAAMAIWTGGIALARADRLVRPASALARVGAPLCLYLLLRRDTVIWAALIGVALLTITPADRRREVIHHRLAWMWAGLAVTAAIVQLQLSGANTATSLVAQGGGDLGDTWAEMPFYLKQIGGGILGWLDTRLPGPVYDLFTYGPALLAAVGALLAPKRVAVAIVAVVLAVLAAPLAIGTIRYGYVQGRYVLPLAFGIPLLGGLALAERVGRRRWPRVFLAGALVAGAVAQTASFAQVMRRFTAGAHGPWWWDAPPSWVPPVLGPTPLFAAFVCATAALYAWLYLLAGRGSRSAEPAATPSVDDAASWGPRRGCRDPLTAGLLAPQPGVPESPGHDLLRPHSC